MSDDASQLSWVEAPPNFLKKNEIQLSFTKLPTYDIIYARGDDEKGRFSYFSR